MNREHAIALNLLNFKKPYKSPVQHMPRPGESVHTSDRGYVVDGHGAWMFVEYIENGPVNIERDTRHVNRWNQPMAIVHVKREPVVEITAEEIKVQGDA